MLRRIMSIGLLYPCCAIRRPASRVCVGTRRRASDCNGVWQEPAPEERNSLAPDEVRGEVDQVHAPKRRNRSSQTDSPSLRSANPLSALTNRTAKLLFGRPSVLKYFWLVKILPIMGANSIVSA